MTEAQAAEIERLQRQVAALRAVLADALEIMRSEFETPRGMPIDGQIALLYAEGRRLLDQSAPSPEAAP